MKIRLSLPQDSITLEGTPHSSLSETIWLSGRITSLPLCTGLACCGRCKVRFLSTAPAPCPQEQELFSPEELELGWRLACRHHLPESDEEISLELNEGQKCPSRTSSYTPKKTDCFLALDLGTTNIVWKLMGTDKELLAQGTFLNPQSGAGSDVMSRLAYCSTEDKKKQLSELIQKSILEIIEEAGYLPQEIILAGNTAMTDIFLQKNLKGLSFAPYTLSHYGNSSFSLPHLPSIYIPPLLAPFLGGDVAAGILALICQKKKPPFVLADLGTNGEIALLREDGELFLASVPLGPALEGIGPDCGRQADAEAITAFSLTPFGLKAQCQSQAPKGISATGYISLLASLVRCGLLSPQGQFRPIGELSPLAKRLAKNIDSSHAIPRFLVECGLWVSLRDIEEILKLKAAFCVALEQVLAMAECSPSQINTCCLAGALGYYLVPEDLVTLGFLPKALEGRCQAVGNSALEGAVLLGLEKELRQELALLCQKAHLYQSTDDPLFHSRYLTAIRFGD